MENLENILLFLLLGFILILTVCFTFSWVKWRKAQIMKGKFNLNDYEIFEKVTFSSIIYSNLKITNSKRINCDIYLKTLKVIILPSSFQLKNYKSKAPLFINLKEYNYEINSLYSKIVIIKIGEFSN